MLREKNLSSWFLTRSDTNQAIQPQMMARGLKFQIEEVEGLYYLCIENKDYLCSKNKSTDKPHRFYAFFTKSLN